MSNLEKLRKKASALPLKPGVYIMRDKENKVIYVGKAKALKNRVYSYFHSVNNHPPKTFALVSNIDDFEIMLVSTEFEALLLECNLIKKYKPKYNILLKDDKGYPYIKFTLHDEYPRILLARQRDNDKAKYFGPYTSATQAKQIIDAVSRAFLLPTCNNTFKGKNGRPCLNHHINRCVGICNGKLSKEEYRGLIDNAISFFEGNSSKVIDDIKAKMELASENLNFEKAAYYRDCLKAVTRLRERQGVVVRVSLTADAISFYQRGENICFAVLSVVKGSIQSSNCHILNAEENDDILNEFICRYYEENAGIPKTIYTEFLPNDIELLKEYLSYLHGGKVSVSVPNKGDGASLIKLAKVNAEEFLTAYEGKTDKLSRSINAFATAIGFNAPPKNIELYDISETAGSNMVAGMVVFEDGKPKKERYRRFNVEDAIGGDDCGALTEVLIRRIARYKANDEAFNILPDLIIVDGGFNQVNAIKAVLEKEKLSLPLIGLKKDIKHRTKAIVLSNGSEIPLKTNPEAFSFAGRMQEEVHRFAVSFHRLKQSKTVKGSSLLEIEGVGKERAKALYQHFKSIKAMKEASIEELSSINGLNKNVAQKIKDYFNN